MNLKEIALRLREYKRVYVAGTPVMLRSRLDFLDIFSAYGLTADMSVSKKIGVLVACSNPMQKKIDQAKALNIPVISEQQWFELMPELKHSECGTESQFRLQMIMEFTILMWAVMVDGPKKEYCCWPRCRHLCPVLVA